MPRRITRKTNSEASAISDRSGFRFPMSEMQVEPGTGWLVHKSETDGEYSLNNHPLNNVGKHLRGKFGDPYPVPNARPRTSEETDTSVKYRASSAISAKSALTSFAKIFVYTVAMSCAATASAEAGIEKRATSILSATASISSSADEFETGAASLSSTAIISSVDGLRILVGESSLSSSADVVANGFISGVSSMSASASVDSADGLRTLVGESSISSDAAVVATGAVPGWEQLGNTKTTYATEPSTIPIGVRSLTGMTTNRVAVTLNVSSASLRAYDFDGTDWVQVGNALSGIGSNNALVAALDSTTIALASANGLDSEVLLKTVEFDGTDWSQVGNSLSIPYTTGDSIAVAKMTSTRIAFADETNGELKAYDWDGTDWSQVGSAFSFAFTSPGLASLTSTQVAVADNVEVQTYEFNGSTWSSVGNLNSSLGLFIGKLDSNSIVSVTQSTEEIKTWSFDGTDWTQDAGTLVFGGDFSLPHVGLIGTDTVAISSSSSGDNITAFKYTSV